MVQPREPELRRAATRLVGAFLDREWVEATAPREVLEERVFKALRKNFEQEAELEEEARRMLDGLGQKAAGMDQRKLFLKIKEQLARERKFVL